jgi:arsenate reductase
MAEAWTRHVKGDVIEPYSAGVDPHPLDPRAVKAMAEVDIDISTQQSKSVEEVGDIPFAYVITVCNHAHETCPIFPSQTKVVHAGFDDPPRLAEGARDEEEAMRHYRRVRDAIKAFVEQLPHVLTEMGRSYGKATGNDK